ncbi:MAG: DNA polymerase III subunit alpha [Planctomycetaceae bacterium]|nr:DNA polymerase III subunit alpha [Planctomycetaceae bacterium]
MADAPIVVADAPIVVSSESGEAAPAANPRPFAHLHCHTQFSLLDGANRIGDYIKKVKESGMTACAMTDHGNMYGALEFYNVCKEAGVNPVIGFEAYIAPGHRTDRSANKQKDAAYHLTLLAQNATGFKNLCKMSSLAFLEGFHYRPRIDKELLEKHSEGVICLSGCASSELSDFLLGERTDEAERLIQWYLKVFGDRFYMEIQNAGFQIQKECADRTIDIANRMGLPLVATNDAHYLNKEDAEAHDVLLCVNTRTFRSDANRMKMESNQLFVRTPEEMYAAFPGQEAAVAMSQEIANRVDIDLDLKTRHYPVFRPPENKTDTEYLRELCLKGLEWRYGENITETHRKRLDFELGVIDKMGYSSYFLIVWDFVRFAMENDIPAGARGSAVGAIVAYLLGLSHVCPIQYDLLFERFLDPKRTEPPDIDIDFCRDGRQAVIDYTKRKYGNANVSQIGTYGTLKAKLVIRDVCRALSVPLSRADEVAKMVPEDPKMTLKKALDESAELKDAYDKDPQIKEVIDIGRRLEGLVRSAGTHAAGVVVADKPLIDYIPLQTISGKEDLVTQWDGPTVEKAGLLKMDFLGLRNLSILHKAVQNVKKFKGVEIDPVKLPLDDKRTFALLQRGETKGVFQLESGGMRDLLTKMKPDKFHDIIATSALYRPGPLEGGLVMQYVDVKNGRMPTPKVHPIIDEILDETYGVMVYQEQVMRILNRLGGIELPSSYACIKAISKKKLKTIAEFREKFIEGSQTQGLDKKTATELFEMIEKFAGYGFNKSHSTAYGAVAYQTAYLKANYPVEFMAALLSCEMENTDRISEHVDDARRMGIEVVRPDLNSSDVEFLPAGEKIIFGLGAIKGLGENVAHAIVDERRANGPFKSIYDLTERVDPKILSKGMLEILVKAGTLDIFGPNREQHTLAIERAVQAAVAKQRDKARGQKSLFGDDAPAQGTNGAAAEAGADVLPEAEDWSHRVKLASEKEVFGFYLSSHPLAESAGKFEKFAQHSTGDLPYVEDRSDVFLGGMISSIKKAQVKKANRNGNTRDVNFDLEDEEGVVRCIMWPDEFARIGHKVTADTLCFIRGKVEKRGREPNVTVNALYTIAEAEAEFTRQVAVKLQRGLHTQDDMTRVRDIMQRFPGRTDVVLVVYSVDEKDPDQKVRYVLAGPAGLRVKPSDEFREAMTAALGESNFDFVGPPRKRIVRPAKPIEAVESGASFQQPARAMATADVGDMDEDE